MIRPLLALCALAMLATGARAQSIGQARFKACVPVDTSVQWDGDSRFSDSTVTRALLDSLDLELTRATEDAVPALLLRLGKAKAAFTSDADYAKARENEYFYNEVGGGYLYTGWHFQELERRFPAHELADDAGWLRTWLPGGGECEGFIPCYVHRMWRPVAEFLKAHPSSAYADSAVRVALLAFGVVDESTDLVHPSESLEPEDIIRLVEELEELAPQLAPRHAAPLLTRAGELRARLGHMDAARKAWQAVVALEDTTFRSCVTALLAAPDRPVLRTEAPRVVHPKRVELSWVRPPEGASAFRIFRAAERAQDATLIASLPPTAIGWVDTSTVPGVSYWYTIAAVRGADTIASVPTLAEVPAWTIRPDAAAVSADGQLYVHGRLANGFPQVLRVSADRRSVERFAGAFLGVIEPRVADELWPHLRALFVADENGDGLLPLPMTGTARGRALERLLRGGIAVVRDTSAQPYDSPWMVAVDEGGASAWIETRYPRRGRPVRALDCVAADSLCWVVRENEVTRVHDDGRVLARASLGQGSLGVSAVHVDSLDGSAWVVLNYGRRLLHVDSAGVARHDVQLSDDWVHAITFDFSRRAAFLAYQRASTGLLYRIDLNRPMMPPQPVAPIDARTRWLRPDGRGGLWIVSNVVSRLDANGRVTVIDATREMLSH